MMHLENVDFANMVNISLIQDIKCNNLNVIMQRSLQPNVASNQGQMEHVLDVPLVWYWMGILAFDSRDLDVLKEKTINAQTAQMIIKI